MHVLFQALFQFLDVSLLTSILDSLELFAKTKLVQQIVGREPANLHLRRNEEPNNLGRVYLAAFVLS